MGDCGGAGDVDRGDAFVCGFDRHEYVPPHQDQSVDVGDAANGTLYPDSALAFCELPKPFHRVGLLKVCERGQHCLGGRRLGGNYSGARLAADHCLVCRALLAELAADARRVGGRARGGAHHAGHQSAYQTHCEGESGCDCRDSFPRAGVLQSGAARQNQRYLRF